eukprot:PITA_33841
MRSIIDQQNQYKGCISEARGPSGGIATLWDKNKWNFVSINPQQHWIRTAFDSRMNNQTIIIYNVYAPNHYREKETCCGDLQASIDGELNSNIIVAGDFNLILHANEKRGDTFPPDPFRVRLEAIIQDHDLMDVAPKNRRCTWSNRKLGSGNIIERLDKFLINISFLSSFYVGYAIVLSSSTFDHYPITLTLKSQCALGPIPFKYFPLWNEIPNVREIVQRTWTQGVEGSASFIWETKQRKVKEEETKWRLKSRQLWLQGGDKNTAFFHKQVAARKLRNNVCSILDKEGNQQNTQEAIRNAATEFYRDLLTETKGEEDYDDLLQHLPKGLTKDMNDSLNKAIEEEEIRSVIWTMNPDKAPGPDGFPICVYRAFWGLIKKDLIKMIKWIQRKGKIGGYTNATFLALIPKENRPSSFSRFRPISLCNASYKILSKILAS